MPLTAGRRANTWKGILCRLTPVPGLIALCPLVSAASIYDMHFHAALDPGSETAHVRLRLDQASHYAREFRFRIDPERHGEFSADGDLDVDPPFATWRPPVDGGDFELTVHIDRQRNGNGLDAYITDTFALLRAEHLFPAARVRMLRGASSRSRLTIEAPSGWSVETRYGTMQDEALDVNDPSRAFSRPTGWLIAGDLGVRREIVEDRRIAVAGPVSHGVRRMDILVLIHWTLPSLLDVFPDFPQRLLVVSAGDPMWRGALSGPASLYLHADRPLINERGTSTLIHELVHVAGISGASPDHDWIVEGLADYYSLQILYRSDAITERRYRRSLDSLERLGRDVSQLNGRTANVRIAARGVGIMVAVDAAIREATDGDNSLDDVARNLAKRGGSITLASFRKAAEDVAGVALDVFDALHLASPN